MLGTKEDDQHDQGHGEHEGGEIRGDHLQPLDGGEHRDGGGDHRISGKKSHPDQAKQHEQGARLGREAARCQRGEGQHAPFTLVVGTQHQQHIFERDHHHDGPEEKGDEGEDPLRSGLQTDVAGKALLEGIERAGAQIAVDDP